MQHAHRCGMRVFCCFWYASLVLREPRCAWSVTPYRLYIDCLRSMALILGVRVLPVGARPSSTVIWVHRIRPIHMSCQNRRFWSKAIDAAHSVSQITRTKQSMFRVITMVGVPLLDDTVELQLFTSCQLGLIDVTGTLRPSSLISTCLYSAY